MVQPHWEKIKERMKDEFGGTQYRHWLEPLSFHSCESGVVRLSVSSNSTCDWIRRHYGDHLKRLWLEATPDIERVEIGVFGGSFAPKSDVSNGSVAASSVCESSALVDCVSRRNHHDENEYFDRRYTFDNFVMGKPNEFAYAAAQRVAQSSSVTFNPLFLYGGVGLGKTHLIHAIAQHIRTEHPQRLVMYLSAEKFMYRFIRALQDRSTYSFKEEFRSVDVLMVDDVQFLAGKASTQEEFFHTFNALVDQGRQVVVSADKVPGELSDLEERLRSRLGSGLVADIHGTDYELRLSILQSKSRQFGIDLQPRVLEFLAHKITSNVRDLEGALTRILAHAQLVGRELSLEMVHEVLHDVLRSYDRTLSIVEIQKKVCEHYGIKLGEMTGARRSRVVARPRQVAMYLCKQLTSFSLPEIGRCFGGRDHTTVMHAVKKVDEICAQDVSFSEDIDILRRLLST